MASSKSKPKAAKDAEAAEESIDTSARYRFADKPKEVYEIDPLDLTGEEQVMVEEMFDQPWNILLAEGWLTQSRKASIFFAYLARRRKEPEFTYEEALRFDPKYVQKAGEEDGEAARPTDASSDGGIPS